MSRTPNSEPTVTLVLGGTRSGKSAIAERLTAEIEQTSGRTVTYLATASVYDDEMAQRVALHRARRPAEWSTVELPGPEQLAEILLGIEGAVLVESLGTWLASCPDFVVDARSLCAALRSRPGPTVVVSEEVGLAVHPPTPVGRAFTDALGSLNQAIAATADRVVLVVAGRILEL